MTSVDEIAQLGLGEMTTAGRHTAKTTPTADSCGSCPHPLTEHDALGTRFCAASATSSLSRGCICGR